MKSCISLDISCVAIKRLEIRWNRKQVIVNSKTAHVKRTAY